MLKENSPDETTPDLHQRLRSLHSAEERVQEMLRTLRPGGLASASHAPAPVSRAPAAAAQRPADEPDRCGEEASAALWHLPLCLIKRTLSWAAVDTAIVLAAYTAVLLARAVATPLDHSLRPSFGAFILAVLLLMQYLFGAYHRIWSRSSGYEVEILLKAVGVATLVVGIVRALPLGAESCALSVILLGNTLALGGFVAARYRGRLLSGFAWRWRAIWFREFPAKQTRVLIVGAGELGQVTAWRLKHGATRDVTYNVVGLVDDDPTKRGMYVEGCEVLGDFRAIPRLVRQEQAELVVVALQSVSGPQFRQILSYCESTEARIKVMPDIFELLSRKQSAPFLRDISAEDFLGRTPIERHPAVDLQPVTHKTILVTGAAGSIGSELSRQLLTFDPTRLVLLDNNESALHDLVTDLIRQIPASAELIIPVLADITNRVEMSYIFGRFKPQVVFHSAAYKHVPMMEVYPNKALQTNVNGTRWAAELARFHGVQRFILISTDKAVCPCSVMGATKRICELIMIALSQQGGTTRYTSVRFGNVLGSRGSVVPTFNRQIEAGGPVTITDKKMRRYFMTIAEACNLVIHAACLTEGGDLFMLNMGNEVAIVDLAERMIRARGLRPYVDIDIQFTGIRPGEKLSEALHSESEMQSPTCHPDIFHLRDKTLELDPREFLARLDKLQSAQFCDDERLRRPLMALANADHLVLETNEMPMKGVEPVPSWLAGTDKKHRNPSHTRTLQIHLPDGSFGPPVPSENA